MFTIMNIRIISHLTLPLEKPFKQKILLDFLQHVAMAYNP